MKEISFKKGVTFHPLGIFCFVLNQWFDPNRPNINKEPGGCTTKGCLTSPILLYLLLEIAKPWSVNFVSSSSFFTPLESTVVKYECLHGSCY